MPAKWYHTKLVTKPISSFSGTKFRCSEVIAPVKSEADDINLYIINFEDLSAPSSPVEDIQPSLPLSKCKY